MMCEISWRWLTFLFYQFWAIFIVRKVLSVSSVVCVPIRDGWITRKRPGTHSSLSMHCAQCGRECAQFRHYRERWHRLAPDRRKRCDIAWCGRVMWQIPELERLTGRAVPCTAQTYPRLSQMSRGRLWLYHFKILFILYFFLLHVKVKFQILSFLRCGIEFWKFCSTSCVD